MGRPGQPGLLGLLVLALHLGLGLALHLALRRPPPPPAGTAPVHVWITRPARPAAPATPTGPRAPVHAAAPPPQATATQPVRERSSAAQPQAITLPAAAAPVPASPGNAAPADAPAPALATPPPAPATLNLALPARPASAPPAAAWARDDARVHGAPLDGGQRMARSLGTDTTLRSVRRGDGFELQRGSGCVQVQPSRAGQILPADSSAPRPALVGRC